MKTLDSRLSLAPEDKPWLGSNSNRLDGITSFFALEIVSSKSHSAQKAGDKLRLGWRVSRRPSDSSSRADWRFRPRQKSPRSCFPMASSTERANQREADEQLRKEEERTRRLEAERKAEEEREARTERERAAKEERERARDEVIYHALLNNDASYFEQLSRPEMESFLERRFSHFIVPMANLATRRPRTVRSFPKRGVLRNSLTSMVSSENRYHIGS